MSVTESSLRDIEELLVERGVVTYETIRCWCDKSGVSLSCFGPIR
jgi:putative transposase